MRAIVIETSGLHLGYLGCYGNDWVATPALDRLAAQAVVFDNHLADLPGSQQPTSWSGRQPFSTANPARATPPLDRLLRTQGVAVARVGSHVPFGRMSPGSLDRCASTVVAALSALDRLLDQEHGLLWVSFPSLTPPWAVPEDCLEPYFATGPPAEGEEEPLRPWLDAPWGPLDTSSAATSARLQNTYAAAVGCFDSQISDLIDALAERGVLEQAWLAITADRGLALGEHGVIGECRPWLHDELVHLPLIVRLPGAAEAGRRVSALTQPADLTPTLLAAFGLPGPSDFDGKDLRPLLTGQLDSIRAFACSALDQGERSEWALRTRDWAFILPMTQAADDPPRPKQLYVKPDDRWEVNNLLQQYLELAEQLEGTLRGCVAD